MSLAVVHSRAQVGIDALPVTVEVHLANGLPSLSMVGLPEAAVKESKDRVRSALLNARFEFPARRITVNLAPADLPKEGGRFDLPIAIGILAASKQIRSKNLDRFEFIVELALTYELDPVRYALRGYKQMRLALQFPCQQQHWLKNNHLCPRAVPEAQLLHQAGQQIHRPCTRNVRRGLRLF